MLDVIALIVMLILIAVGIWLVVIIGNLPGKMAHDAGHPQAEAITLLGWIGLLTGGLGWLLALVWARVRPGSSAGEVEQRIQMLEGRLKTLEATE